MFASDLDPPLRVGDKYKQSCKCQILVVMVILLVP